MLETREAWLNKACSFFAPWLEREGFPLAYNVRISVGFPSRNGLSKRKRAIGECWMIESSGDKSNEIFVSPLLDDPIEVLAVAAHELVHAATPGEGHKGRFVKGVRVLGLEGPPTATVPGDLFKERIRPVLNDLGEFPHAKLVEPLSALSKKQTTRMIKCACKDCGYTVRTAKKWIEVATPLCPVDGILMTCDMPDAD